MTVQVRRLDILDDTVEDIVSQLYSDAYGGRHVHGCYEQPANLAITIAPGGNTDLHVDLDTQVGEGMVTHSSDKVWGLTYYSGDLVGAHTRAPFSYPQGKVEAHGLFADAVEALGRVHAVLAADDVDSHEVVEWFKGCWGVKSALDYSRHIPVLEGTNTIGLSGMDANLAPTLKAYPGKHRAAIPKWHAVTRESINKRTNRDLVIDFAKMREVARYIAITLGVEGFPLDNTRIDFNIITKEAAIATRTTGDPLPLKIEKQYDSEPFYVSEYRSQLNEYIVRKADRAADTYTNNLNVHLPKLNDLKEEDVIEQILGRDIRLIRDKKTLLAAINDVDLKEDYDFSEVKGKPIVSKLQHRFKMNWEDLASLFDHLIPQNYTYRGRGFDLSGPTTERFERQLEKHISEAIIDGFHDKLVSFSLLTHKLREDAYMFVRDVYLRLGYRGHLEREDKVDAKLRAGLADRNILETWARALEIVGKIRTGRGMEITYMKQKFLTDFLTFSDFLMP